MLNNNTNKNREKTQHIEVKSAQEAIDYLANLADKTVIFIDIDDTIITPLSTTFRASPYNKIIDNIKKDKEKYSNYEQIISNWRLQRKAILIDPLWPKMLAKLREKFIVYGLTKTDVGTCGNIPSMEKWRYEELKSFGLEFSNEENIKEQNIDNSSFYKGILLSGVNKKSETIEKHIKILPKNIVMIDDRKEHLDDIKNFCDKKSINFIGLLFTGLNLLKGNPDPNIFAIQKYYLIEKARWLEDDIAKKILDTDKKSN